MLQMLLLFAEDAKPQSGGGGFEMMLLPLMLMTVMFLFLFRGGKRQEQERAKLLSTLKKNDRVITTSGIYGTVVAVSETEDAVTVRVDDNVRLKMLKSTIARNLTNEEAAAAEKAARDGKKDVKKEGVA